MVSVEKLDLDVWDLILSHLSTADLYAVALTSRSFLTGVISRLYHTIFFRLQHAKKYPGVCDYFISSGAKGLMFVDDDCISGNIGTS